MKLANSPAMLTMFGKIEANILAGGRFATPYREACDQFNNDARLAWLISATGKIADTMAKHEPLLHTASIAFAWLETCCGNPADALVLVSDERLRQQRLFAEGKIYFSVASPVPNADRKLRVLVEEIGEVAEAIDRLEGKHTFKVLQRRVVHLRTELVQVAAVCVAWLESLEVQS